MNYTARREQAQDVCRYCGSLVRIIPEFSPADFHTSAACVAGDEPSFKMGGPVPTDHAEGIGGTSYPGNVTAAQRHAMNESERADRRAIAEGYTEGHWPITHREADSQRADRRAVELGYGGFPECSLCEPCHHCHDCWMDARQERRDTSDLADRVAVELGYERFSDEWDSDSANADRRAVELGYSEGFQPEPPSLSQHQSQHRTNGWVWMPAKCEAIGCEYGRQS